MEGLPRPYGECLLTEFPLEPTFLSLSTILAMCPSGPCLPLLYTFTGFRPLFSMISLIALSAYIPVNGIGDWPSVHKSFFFEYIFPAKADLPPFFTLFESRESVIHATDLVVGHGRCLGSFTGGAESPVFNALLSFPHPPSHLIQ